MRVDLIEPTEISIATPVRVGLPKTTLPAPWSVSRLQALLQALEHQPSEASDRAARLARYQLSRFWLSAPVDQLQLLYEAALGDLQRMLLRGPLAQQELAGDEQQWRDQLTDELHNAAQHAHHVNILLAVMPYCASSGLHLKNIIGTVPIWLIKDYSSYLEQNISAPVGLLEAGDDTSLPPLTQRRGDEAMVWFRDEVALQRMHELILAYGHDPIDPETLLELAGLRRVLAQLWIDIVPTQLQRLEETSVGTVTRALIRSGFGQELTNGVDRQAREHLCERATDFKDPAAAGFLLAALLFVPLESVKIESINALPEWCIDFLHDLASDNGQL